MVRGYEVVKELEAKLRREKERIFKEAESKKYDDVLKTKRFNKTLWMFYGIFGVVSIVCVLLFFKYDSKITKTLLEVLILVNFIVAVTLLCFTNVRINKARTLYLEEMEASKNEVTSVKALSDDLARVAILSLVYDKNIDELDLMKEEDAKIKLVNLANKYIEEIYQENPNTTSTEIMEIYRKYIEEK